MSRHKEIKLKYPDPDLKPPVTVLKMRPPKARDQLSATRNGGNTPADQEVHLLASLCEVETGIIESLELYDYLRVQDAYGEFAAGKHDPETPISAKS